MSHLAQRISITNLTFEPLRRTKPPYKSSTKSPILELVLILINNIPTSSLEVRFRTGAVNAKILIYFFYQKKCASFYTGRSNLEILITSVAQQKTKMLKAVPERNT